MKRETIKELTEKRKFLWKKYRDFELDSQVVESIARRIIKKRELLEEILKKPYLLIEACFTVVDKEKQSVPFFLNEVQEDFICQLEKNGTKKPYFILKGRQQGFTTLITAIQLSYAITQKNFAGFTLADRDDNTKAIFIDKAKVMYNSLPTCLKPSEKFNSTNELFFDVLNSSWRVASATANVGRSRTLSFIHYSELAFFKCSLSDLQKSIQEAATKNAICIYETTANGLGEAKALWDSGACVNLFYEWYRTKEYTESDHSYLKTCDTWLKNRLKILSKHGLSRDQLAWYAKKYSSYLDKASIKQEYPCTPEEAFISSGESIFNVEEIMNYISSYDFPSQKGYFEYKKGIFSKSSHFGSGIFTKEISDIKFIPSDDGFISIVEPPYSKQVGDKLLKKPYVIGADIAGCGEDYFTAKVIDNTNGRCVATLHIKSMDEDLFAETLYCLGKYYNDALIGVETNFSRHPVRVLRELGYTNLYVSKSLSTNEDRQESFYGFVTTSVSRPIIISNLVSVMRENLRLETDKKTLLEMTTFVRRSDGSPRAEGSCHDDLVMASAIARFISIEYAHEMSIFDTGVSVFEKSFSSPTLSDEAFMEW